MRCNAPLLYRDVGGTTTQAHTSTHEQASKHTSAEDLLLPSLDVHLLLGKESSLTSGVGSRRGRRLGLLGRGFRLGLIHYGPACVGHVVSLAVDFLACASRRVRLGLQCGRGVMLARVRVRQCRGTNLESPGEWGKKAPSLARLASRADDDGTGGAMWHIPLPPAWS